MNQKTIIFYGPSGSGKGTQAKLLIEHLKETDSTRPVLYLETGARLRQFLEGSGYTQAKVKAILDKGGLLPEFLPIWVWTDFLIDSFTGIEHLVFDGITRRMPEATVLDGALSFYERTARDVVVLNVSREWSVKRLTERGRYDDNPEDINKRLDWFEEHVRPTIDFFRKNPRYTMYDINGEQPIEEVQHAIRSALKLL